MEERHINYFSSGENFENVKAFPPTPLLDREEEKCPLSSRETKNDQYYIYIEILVINIAIYY